jgi:hypothetical protein
MARPKAAAPFRVRSRGHADALLAVATGVELQIELLFADGARGELLAARGLMLVLAVAIALRRRAPLVAVGLAMAVFLCVEPLLPDGVADELAVSFVALLLISYSLGSSTDGRRLAAGIATMLAAGAGIGLDDPPGGFEVVARIPVESAQREAVAT